MLLVDESTGDDQSTVALSPTKMNELGLFSGDSVLLKGKKRKDTVATVASDDSVSDLKMRMHKSIRSNLRSPICLFIYALLHHTSRPLSL
jgi:transitional endoplasmic reticulum ATPase